MSTRKRKQESSAQPEEQEQEEELVALPSDESEEEEEYVFSLPFERLDLDRILTVLKDMLTPGPRTVTPRMILMLSQRPQSPRDAK